MAINMDVFFSPLKAHNSQDAKLPRLSTPERIWGGEQNPQNNYLGFTSICGIVGFNMI